MKETNGQRKIVWIMILTILGWSPTSTLGRILKLSESLVCKMERMTHKFQWFVEMSGHLVCPVLYIVGKEQMIAVIITMSINLQL